MRNYMRKLLGIWWVNISERLAAKMGEIVMNIIQLQILSPEEGLVLISWLLAC